MAPGHYSGAALLRARRNPAAVGRVPASMSSRLRYRRRHRPRHARPRNRRATRRQPDSSTHRSHSCCTCPTAPGTAVARRRRSVRRLARRSRRPIGNAPCRCRFGPSCAAFGLPIVAQVAGLRRRLLGLVHSIRQTQGFGPIAVGVQGIRIQGDRAIEVVDGRRQDVRPSAREVFLRRNSRRRWRPIVVAAARGEGVRRRHRGV